MEIIIRNESENDYRVVEELTREAFWNLHVPGCDEHFLVHIMRKHTDFISALDYIAIVDDKIVGNIMYTKSRLEDENGFVINAITFGPVSVLPEFQRKGIGSALIQYSIEKATSAGYKAILIFGHPHNYCKHGFKSSKSFNISTADGKFPYSLLALELEKGFLNDNAWKYYPSEVYEIDKKSAQEFDKLFPPKKKEFRFSQEEFNIACRAFIE